MTTTKSWKSANKKPTTLATTGDQDLAGCRPQEEQDAQKVSQIVKQLKGGSAMPNSEFNQIFNTTNLPDEEFDAMGQAALTANVEYYQALCAKARRTHQEYLTALTFWQSKLDRLNRPL